jgi:hypothetical protein
MEKVVIASGAGQDEQARNIKLRRHITYTAKRWNMNRGFSVACEADIDCRKRRNKRIQLFVNLLFTLSLDMIAVMAQDNTATITGAVTDANGAAVVGAQVSNTHTQSRQTRRAVTGFAGRLHVFQSSRRALPD